VNDSRPNDPATVTCEDACSFLDSGGEMGALMRTHDWSSSSLGFPATWPQALRTAVRLLLNTGHPMYIFWGADGACLYNDPFSQSIGPERHPGSLGRPAREVWGEIWDIIGGQFEQVMSGGGATWHENQLVPLTRHGRREDVYWTYSYGPIDQPSAATGVGGVLVVCTETTEAVLAQRRQAFLIALDEVMAPLSAPETAMKSAAALLGEYLGVGRCGHGEIDPSGEFTLVESDWTDGTMSSLAGRHSLEGFGADIAASYCRGETVRIEDVHEDRRTRSVAANFAKVGGVRAGIGVPRLVNDKLVASFFVHQTTPRRWSDEEVALVRHVAERTWASIDRAQAEKALSSSERELRFALDAGRFGAWTLDIASGQITASDAFGTNFGMGDQTSFSYAELNAAVHPDDRDRMQAALAHGIETGANFDIDYRTLAPDGIAHWTGLRGRPSLGPGGAPERIVGVSLDITERKNHETRRLALVELADRIATLSSPADLAYAGAEVLGRTLGLSRAGYATIDPAFETATVEKDWTAPGIGSVAGVHQFRNYGSFIDDLKQGEIVVIADADTDPRTASKIKALKAIDIRALVNLPVIEQGVLVALLYLHQANPREWSDEELAFAHDVAGRIRMAIERSRAEQAVKAFTVSLERRIEERTAELRANQVQLRTIFETSYQYQGLLAVDGTLLDTNATSLEAIGARMEDVVGMPFWETPWFTATPGMAQAVRDAVAKTAQGETVRSAFALNLPGRKAWFDFSMRPMVGANGDIVGLLPEAVETTQRHLAEEQLRHAQKMEAIGKLTGGVAHDFNNLLQVIGGNLELVAREVAGNERIERRLENILAGVDRGARLVSHLLAFGRRQSLTPKVIHPGELVKGLDDMIGHALGGGIAIDLIIADDLWNTLADPGQIENALLNLALNARDAMAGQGRLTVELDNRHLEEKDLAAFPDVSPGDYVMLAVTDTGTGMSPSVTERAFEPFYTTKALGQGTGLGLSMVWGFVKQSGGGSETILVVEDDENVRSVVTEMLSEMGYRLLEASDAKAALDLIEAGARPDLLFTDVVMPGPLRAPELVRRAREIMPGLPVVYASGYSAEQIVDDDRLDEGIELLGKPFGRGELASKLRQILDHSEPTASTDTASLQDRDPACLRILLVEDNHLIRMGTADMLAALGHQILEADTGEEALRLIGEHRIDLLLTDIGLPGMSGDDLAAEVRRRMPGLPVVFASGHDSHPASSTGLAPGDAVQLTKPFEEEELARAIAKAIGP